ncbi:BrnT family toxin [Sphingomonas adhaesiva]|uniref:BrnT family toxin n=1 Tax=Sphingomonas adhaesiva TaxID=28212 RepID=UPI002FF7B200
MFTLPRLLASGSPEGRCLREAIRRPDDRCPAFSATILFNFFIACSHFCAYNKNVNIVFDPAKDAANIAKHGLSLADAAGFELAAAAVAIDNRREYGEDRFRAFGYAAGQARCLVFTVRDGAVRVISYRRAHAKEMRRYGL